MTRVARVMLCLLVLALPGTGGAHADVSARLRSAMGFPEVTRTEGQKTLALQSDLAWIGFYHGAFDGVAGPELRSALSAYQTSLGKTDLSADDRQRLRRLAQEATDAARMKRVELDWTGIAMTLPIGYLETPELIGTNLLDVFYAGRSALDLSVTMFRGTETLGIDALLQTWADVARTSDETGEVLAHERDGQSGILVIRQGGLRHYFVFGVQRGDWRGVKVSVLDRDAASAGPLLALVLSRIDLFHGPGVRKSEIRSRVRSGDYPGAIERPAWFHDMISNGSGSIVSFRGDILTNFHVVSNCASLTVNGNPAFLVGTDFRVDLALIRSEKFEGKTPVQMREGSAVLGEGVYVTGYPVFDLSPAVNLTSGVVSSSVGMMGNRSHIQITAPVQPGNSGGPVFDSSGVQIATVVSKITAGAQVRRNVENMAFVIRSSEAIEFLNRFGVTPIVTDRPAGQDLTARTDRIRQMRDQTVRVECHDP